MHHDAIVVGGSFAGLAAALYIARARRKVCVLDTGLPRNRFAEHSHGFFTRDGSAPRDMLATARAQLAAYPTVTFVDDAATDATGEIDEFSVALAQGGTVEGARLVLAFGLSDDLPAVPGLAERWGVSVVTCPYCHGFEYSDRQLGVLSVSPLSAHHAMLIAEWGPTTYYLNGAEAPDMATLTQLAKRRIRIEPAPVKALHGEGAGLQAIELGDGRMSAVDFLYTGTRTRFNSDLAERLGCALDDAPSGSIVRTDEQKATTVPGVYAAGDITRGAHSVTWAVSDGVTAGTSLHRSLVF